jgi:hypothetical protein
MADLVRIEGEIARLRDLSLEELRAQWQKRMRTPAPACFKSDLLFRVLAYEVQVKALGDLDRTTERLLDRLAEAENPTVVLASLRRPRMKPGTELIREWGGTGHRVVVTEGGYAYAGQTYASLSEIARLITGTNWNGPRFFGLRQEKRPDGPATIVGTTGRPRRGRPRGQSRDDHVEHQAGGMS